MNRIFVFLLFVFSFCVHAQEVGFTDEEKTWIKNHPIIEFGYESNWEPYEIYENGQYSGIVGDYVHILEEKTGIDMQPIPGVSWEESLDGLRNGTIHIVPCCAKTPERESFLEFTDVYINDPLVIVTRKDYQFISDLSDFNGKKIALPFSYYTAELITTKFPQILIEKKESVKACLEALSYGEVEAFVGNLGVVSYHINNSGFTNLKVAAPTNYKTNGIALAVTKDWKIFRDISNKVFQSISTEERLVIRSKWIDINFEYGVDWDFIIKWILILAVIFGLIFLFLFYWNNKLRKEVFLRKSKEIDLKKTLTLIKKQDNEKKILLQEIHHRVKNNLQIITSLMSLQRNALNDQKTKQVLSDAMDRVRSIALIHDKIYKSKNINNVNMKDYIHSLANDVILNFSKDQKIKLEIHASNGDTSLDTLVPVALILNELLTNSIKYGFLDTEKGIIKIDCLINERNISLNYSDNGVWFNNPQSDHFGTSLIEIFTEQLDGKYTLEKKESGTFYYFTFNLF